MSAEQLSSIAAIVISLALAYVPGLAPWFNAREGTQKAGITALLIILVAIGAFAVSCGQLVTFAPQPGVGALTCDKAGAVGLAANLIAALVANQSAYVLLVKPFNLRSGPQTQVPGPKLSEAGSFSSHG